MWKLRSLGDCEMMRTFSSRYVFTEAPIKGTSAADVAKRF